MFSKAEINTAQLEILEAFIGPMGIYFETILDDKEENLGTKIVFLQKAIEEEPQAFSKSLDYLFVDSSQENNLELIRSLKIINDFCFNNDIKYGQYGIKSALTHFFGRFGKVEPSSFQEKIRSMIREQIKSLLNEANLEQIETEKETANLLLDEDLNQANPQWRQKLDLPSNQNSVSAEEDNLKTPKINRSQLNALRHLIANHELSLEEFAQMSESKKDKLFLTYFALKGLSIPLAKGLEFKNEDLALLFRIKTLITKNLITVDEVINFTPQQKKLFNQIILEKGREARAAHKKSDLIEVYNEFRQRQNQPIPKEKIKETETIISSGPVRGIKRLLEGGSLLWIDMCTEDKISGRRFLAKILEQIGLEKSDAFKQMFIDGVIEYSSHNALSYPDLVKNLEIIAELTEKQLAQSDSNQENILLINQVAKEILSIITEPQPSQNLNS